MVKKNGKKKMENSEWRQLIGGGGNSNQVRNINENRIRIN